ncbi:hypothetical protein ACP275_13G094700 [Erythranthe tilingii]
MEGSGSGTAGVICPDDEDARMAEEDSPEESSWTFYIEGFMRDDNDNNDNDDNNYSLSSASEMIESPSLVSDAASSAVVKKLSSYYNCVCRNIDDDDNDGACRLGFTSAAAKGSIRTMFKQNSFKKQKTKVFLPSVMDYDLEDTASSPVNSPKVSYMNQFMNQKDKAKIDVSEVKRKSIGKGGIFAVERDNNYTDLQKRTCG